MTKDLDWVGQLSQDRGETPVVEVTYPSGYKWEAAVSPARKSAEGIVVTTLAFMVHEGGSCSWLDEVPIEELEEGRLILGPGVVAQVSFAGFVGDQKYKGQKWSTQVRLEGSV